MLLVDEVFHMWYSGGGVNKTVISYATSEDESQWKKYGQPVLGTGPAGSWESQLIWGANVFFDSTKNSYKMWYIGTTTSDGGIGYAESDTCTDIVRPVLEAEDTCYQCNFIEATSSEDGIIYLVPHGIYYTVDALREACIDSVTAIANTPVQIPLADQPNGLLMLHARDNSNNISDYERIAIMGVGISENGAKSSISIYPNPAASLVNIRASIPGEYTVVIESLNGQEISSYRFNGTSHQIDLSSYQKGIYLITVRSKDFVTTRKTIKL